MNTSEEKKKLFQKFSEENEDLLPFSLRYSWWNEVVGKSWDLTLISNENQVSAVWPYHIRKRGPWNLIVQPHFTPYSGVFMIYPEGSKASTKISFENKVCEELINQLPDFDELKQNFHLDFKNTLPFVWEGFEDIKRYTYLLDLNPDKEKIYENFRANIRKQIQKAEKQIELKEATDASNLKLAFEGSFESQNIGSPIDDEQIFKRIFDYVSKYKCGQVLEAFDANGNLYAAALFIWDNQQAYYLIGGSVAAYKNSGAMSLLMWQGIQLAKVKGLNQFNFEGSSIKAIEKYLRGFGGELHSFSCIFKNNSKTLNFARKVKG